MFSRTSTPSFASDFRAACRRLSGNAASTDGPASTSSTRACSVRIDRNSSDERLARDLRDRSGHLDAGRAAADDHERQQRPAELGVRPRARRFRRRAASAARICSASSSVFSDGRVRLPLVVPEVRARRSRGHDQVVVVERRAVIEIDAPGRGVDVLRLGEQHVGYSADGAGSSGSARRCRPATAPRSPPDRAAAGRHDGCGDRRASRAPARASALSRPIARQIRLR